MVCGQGLQRRSGSAGPIYRRAGFTERLRFCPQGQPQQRCGQPRRAGRRVRQEQSLQRRFEARHVYQQPRCAQVRFRGTGQGREHRRGCPAPRPGPQPDVRRARGTLSIYQSTEITRAGKGNPYNFPLGQGNREDMDFARVATSPTAAQPCAGTCNRNSGGPAGARRSTPCGGCSVSTSPQAWS